MAVKRKQIDANPFIELATAVRGNRARQHFVTRQEFQAIIDAAPDVDWQAIIALSRYGGLRVPSELLTLRWADVNLPAGEMTVRATKTEHYEGSGIRVCPIFAELKPYLEAAWDAAEPGTEFVINRYRQTNANLRTQLLRIMLRAGVKPWPKLFHNMRATRQTELFKIHPIQDVCSWLGNSRAVALEHYAQVTNEAFQAALQGEAESEAVPKQNAKQQPTAANRMVSQIVKETAENNGVLHSGAAECQSVRSEKVTPMRTISLSINGSGMLTLAYLPKEFSFITGALSIDSSRPVAAMTTPENRTGQAHFKAI
ncbi:tyrosine-type recombinase/integrase [Anatilimnocola floriformis]|uniref:tyrosine-type recombinase/integrase n=1 Tax=Anatilimnocola floriformis TaxID=2948575 RepID=UPI0020C36C58|nr:site-specific integrase [Anatilimnocola floriformis]